MSYSQNSQIRIHHNYSNFTSPPSPVRCKCGSTSYARISHIRKRKKGTTNNDPEVQSFIQSLNITNTQFVFSQTQLNQNNRNLFENQTTNKIQDEITPNQIASGNFQQFNFVYSQSDEPNIQSNSASDNTAHSQTPSEYYLIFSKNHCKCGANDHFRTSYRYCPLNPKIVTSQLNTQIPMDTQTQHINRFKCGSIKHLRTNHKDCPLNKKLINNSQANQIESLDDLNDFLQSTSYILHNQHDANNKMYIFIYFN